VSWIFVGGLFLVGIAVGGGDAAVGFGIRVPMGDRAGDKVGSRVGPEPDIIGAVGVDGVAGQKLPDDPNTRSNSVSLERSLSLYSWLHMGNPRPKGQPHVNPKFDTAG